MAAIGAVLAFAAPALAQVYVERPYDPPIGSRWQIVSQSDTEEMREAAGQRDQHFSALAELTIEEKLPDGFRITYVTRGIDASGSVPGTEVAAAAFQSMKDIVIRARTDRSGKPVAIENLDEVRGKMRTVVDRVAEAFKDKPEMATVMRQILESMLLADDKRAAELYIDEIPTLASVQNTGLKPGDEARASEEMPSPLGGTIRSVTITKLAAWDGAAGTARYVRTREFDKDALRAFVLAMVRKMQPAADDKITPQMIELMKQINFTLTSDGTFSLEGGMTRSVVENSTVAVNLMGHTFTKSEKKTVTVTPLPKN
jgi:hypothetical protein